MALEKVLTEEDGITPTDIDLITPYQPGGGGGLDFIPQVVPIQPVTPVTLPPNDGGGGATGNGLTPSIPGGTPTDQINLPEYPTGNPTIKPGIEEPNPSNDIEPTNKVALIVFFFLFILLVAYYLITNKNNKQ